MERNKRTVSCTSGGGEYTSQNAFDRAFEMLQSLRQDEILCDVNLETVDGAIVHGHKVVLAAASPYFRAMFTNFEESHKDRVVIRELDSEALRLVVDFIYTAKIVVTENNVQVLLSAASLLQLNDVQDACCNFLQTHLCPMNCFGIKALADLHGCTELSSCSEFYIRKHFTNAALGDEFLSISFEQVVKLISCDDLAVPSEEKVYESVIRWVNHNSDSRKDVLPKLMEHVRLPLISNRYLQKIVKEGSLAKLSSAAEEYIIDALVFQKKKFTPCCSVPTLKRTKPREYTGVQKVILVVGGNNQLTCGMEWYDPETNLWQSGPEIRNRNLAAFAVLNGRCVFSVGGIESKSVSSVDVLDFSLPFPYWVQTVSMLTARRCHGVAVLDNYIYAVGGYDNSSRYLNSAEVFHCGTKKWRMISNMSTARSFIGFGVLNNRLYAVGGFNGRSLNSVECYRPHSDTWIPIENMSTSRTGAGVGVVDGVLYAIGGRNISGVVKSVEAYKPSLKVWTSVSDMRQCRAFAGVVALGGLLYVIGGLSKNGNYLDSVEIYNPNTDCWSMLTTSMNIGRSRAGVFVVDKPSC